MLNEKTVETIELLQKSTRKRRPDTHVKFSLDMEDYYRIKGEEKIECDMETIGKRWGGNMDLINKEFLQDISELLDSARKQAKTAVNLSMVYA